MQSSPPVRAWEQRDSQDQDQDESDYSLDLGALDMDTVSDMDIPKQKVDRIFSEDIDGPSDFTQNMEMWMRGGKTPSRKGTLKGTKSTTHPIEEGREDAEDNVIRRDMLQVNTISVMQDRVPRHAPLNFVESCRKCPRCSLSR